jgi:glutamate synthase domain-containing protein 2
MPRLIFLSLSLLAVSSIALLGRSVPEAFILLLFVAPIVLVGIWDMIQTKHAICRNFPVVGHFRYMFEAIRPEMQQYFIESDTNGTPFSREQRSVVYQRAKDVRDTVPFGTRHDVYAVGYQWIDHSLAPKHAPDEQPRVRIGGPDCAHPYDAALLNISAMSYGSLSRAAVRALNGGARDGGFFHNTGEGGVSPYHVEPGGDLCWQIGTGYFGCRAADGGFDAACFQETVRGNPSIKLIEIKLSQGAKPGHGGILPASKVTEEVSRIRGVPMGADVLSPPSHKAFSGPDGLVAFVAQLRELSGGLPVGFKLCIGKPQDFLAICKAMEKAGVTPDFITVDGGEGGTGAAPLEFSNSMGAPLFDGLHFVNGALTCLGLRQRITLIASGGVIDGFDMAVRMALGADLCSSARGMMFALGCIQALRCNSNDCPTGVATQDETLERGLISTEKRPRVAHFQEGTVHALLELCGAAGLAGPHELAPHLIHRRISPTQTVTLDEIYPPVRLDRGPLEKPWDRARADAFA